MTLFDRHIARRVLAGYLFFTISLIVFFIVLHYVEFVDDFFDRGATFRQVFTVYYPSYVPEIVRLTSPLSLFLACVYVTGRLAQELQLTALQASGVSLYRLLVPYLVVGALLTGAMFWFNGWIVPVSNHTRLAFEDQYIRDAPGQLETSEIHRQNRPGSIVSVGYYDRGAQVGYRVSLQSFDGSQRLVRRVDSASMTWIDSLGVWRLHEAVVRDFASGGERYAHVPLLDTTINLGPRDLARTEHEVDLLTIPDAAEYVASLRRSGASHLEAPLVGYYGKFAYPIANLILVLVGVPLASVRRRGGQAMQLGLGLVTAFVYLAMIKLTEPFGYSGDLPPLLTAWLPHACFLFFGLVLLARVRK